MNDMPVRMSERECDRAAAKPPTIQKGIIATPKTKINPDGFQICRGLLYCVRQIAQIVKKPNR